MAIRGCRLIGIEGPQGSGKTTLVHALTAEFKSRDVLAACSAEVTRDSPYFADSIFRGIPVDLSTELHIFGSLIAREHEMARNHDVLFCDRTLINVLAYARISVNADLGSFNGKALDTLQNFCRVYAQLYDLTFYISDYYDPSLTRDPFRPSSDHSGRGVEEYRLKVEVALRQACRDCDLKPVELPTGMNLHEKVAWISDQMQL